MDVTYRQYNGCEVIYNFSALNVRAADIDAVIAKYQRRMFPKLRSFRKWVSGMPEGLEFKLRRLG
jgi:hypothetical protein